MLLRKVLAKFQNTATEGKSLFAAISRRGNSLGMIWPGLGISLFIVSNSLLRYISLGQIVSNLSIHYVSNPWRSLRFQKLATIKAKLTLNFGQRSRIGEKEHSIESIKIVFMESRETR